MEIELTSTVRGVKLEKWSALLAAAGLKPEESPDITVLIWDADSLIATGSRQGNVLKYIAVADDRRGEDLTATVLTQLRQDAFEKGYNHLFLYTKPRNEFLFSSLFFYPIAKTADVLLMEDKRNGIESFLASLPAAGGGLTGAAVMNCNPFTNGHRYLIETAAAECDRLYVFVLSEDRSEFSAADRLEMVRLGTKDLQNVTVLPTGPYLISSATFPSYFLKDQKTAPQVQCMLDIEVFAKYYAPRFSITRRYVGSEPFCPVTEEYNRALAEALPAKGIALRQIPRLEQGNAPISASAVRKFLQAKDFETLRTLVPETTYKFLIRR